MKLKLDENIPLSSKGRLSDLGFDERVAQTGVQALATYFAG